MAYINAHLAPCPGYGWEGGPEFRTQIVELQNGRERRNAEWSQAKHRYSAPFMNISKEAYRQIKEMHLVCRGQLHCFKFRDTLDNSASQEFFAVGDGVTTSFQLSKTSSIGGVGYTRGVYAIDNLRPFLITVNGDEVEGYTVDTDRGLVLFEDPPAPGDVLRWSGGFDVWVRFSEDYLPFTLDNPNAVNGSVNLIEVAPPPPEV